MLEAKHELNTIKRGTPGPNSLEHLLTHLPKHPDCQICKISKMKNKHCRRKVKIDPTEKVPGKHDFGLQVAGDTIVSKRENSVSSRGKKYALGILDVGTAWEDFYPMSNRDTKEALSLIHI